MPGGDDPDAVIFDEAAYLRRHPDIAEAVRSGFFPSGLAHYLRHGRAEKRVIPSLDRRGLMLSFCSLGHNCEFGSAQRKLGAEPLDLLRWAATPTVVLLKLLDNRFAQVGDPSVLTVEPNDLGELVTKNTRYDFLWHTWTFAAQATPEDVLWRESRRLPRLAEKLIDELESGGDRIFVRLGTGGTDDLRHGSMILEAIRAYNPKNNLLFVTVADDDHPAGSVERRAGGLLVGRLAHFADPNNVPLTTDHEVWLRVCWRATQLVRG